MDYWRHISTWGLLKVKVIYFELEAFAEIAKGTVGQVSVWQILWYVFRLQIRVAP